MLVIFVNILFVEHENLQIIFGFYKLRIFEDFFVPVIVMGSRGCHDDDDDDEVGRVAHGKMS